MRYEAEKNKIKKLWSQTYQGFGSFFVAPEVRFRSV